MNASNTTLLLTLAAVGTAVVTQKKLMGSSTQPVRTKKMLTLIQKQLPALKLSPIARIFDQLTATTTPAQLKQYEAQLLTLADEKNFYSFLWKQLTEGSIQAQSLASMVFLRNGIEARTWVATQLQDTHGAATSANLWVVSFLKHQFSL